MVVSDILTYADIFAAVQKVEQDLARTVNPTVMTAADWRHRRNSDDSFAARVAEGPRLFVIGSEVTSPSWRTSSASGKLKPEPPSAAEIAALMRSGHARLVDARNESLSVESRFDLAYNAAHAIALAALRRLGFRSDNRYIVFQALPHTAGIDTVNWRVLAKAHGERNMLEYEGGGMIDQRLLDDLLAAAGLVEAKVTSLIVGDATQH